jgi:2-hydroxy-6-oxonona-2,4-dienedioate hydrolase
VILLGRRYLRERWDTLNGLRVFSRVSKNVSEAGGTPIVLVHGLGVSSRYMTPLAVEWALEHPVYAPDLPGYGRSQTPVRVLGVRELAEALREWLRVVGIDRAAFVGNSMGCQILVELADLDPQCMVAAALLGPTMDQTAKSRFSHVVGLLKDQFREPPSLVPMQAFDYLGNGPVRTVITFLKAVKHDMLARVSRLQVPCVVLRGEFDEIVSQVWVEELARRMPRSRVETIAAAGHALNYNAAPVIGPLILWFWRECGVRV